jgi:uncharacterized membrane protein
MSIPWLLAVAAVFYGLHNVFTRAAGPRIDETLGALLLEGFAAAIILVFYLWRRWSGFGGPVTRAGVLYSLAGGACVGIGTLAYFAIFTRGGQLSQAGPFMLVGGTVVMTIAGIVLFGETLTVARGAGILLALISLALLRWKP